MGIDPGYGCSGVVLVHHGTATDTVLECGLFEDLLGRDYPTLYRSTYLAGRIAERVLAWVDTHSIAELAIAIELPIYNRNAEAYAKQWTLIQALEHALCTVLVSNVHLLHIAEPNPTESKHLATGSGSASKTEMFKRSPFASTAFAATIEKLTKDERETLSDAWAHSLAARAGKSQCDRRFTVLRDDWVLYGGP